MNSADRYTKNSRVRVIYQYLWNCPYNRVLELLDIGSHDCFFTSLLTLGRNCFKPLAELIKDEILSYPIVLLAINKEDPRS